jgi:hypothetical protein
MGRTLVTITIACEAKGMDKGVLFYELLRDRVLTMDDLVQPEKEMIGIILEGLEPCYQRYLESDKEAP